MFTGLVQAVGRLELCAGGVRVRPPSGTGFPAALGAEGLAAMALGDSIAVDGVCLTVAELLGDAGGGGFRADVSEETLRRSTLHRRASERALVNLEPALRLSDRLGGHLVSGHVDGQGRIVSLRAEQASWWLEIAWQEPAFGRYICEKASVAVDGISLTVADCAPAGDRFRIAVIPHTWAATTLTTRRQGDLVNLEADLLAKYTERLLAARDPAAAAAGAPPPLSAGWLSEQGW
ncbi:MAG: riboflavin synthase [Synechococcaceae cyanobacterium]|nr:riboflavin synthase [Synechococcaceae cyanobacterium]